MPKPKTPKVKKSTVVSSLDRNKNLVEYKKKNGLPTWKEIQQDEEKGMSTRIEEKLRLMARFNVENERLYQIMTAGGYDILNIIHDVVNLKNNLLEYDEALRSQGINPVTDDKFMKARDALMKDLQFITKQKLDIAEFQHKIEKTKEKRDDDSIFVVEGGDDD